MKVCTVKNALYFSLKKEKGLTIIELLVTIVILSILAAISLPSFLGQVNKSRESEAITNIGIVNRAQQAYRFENSTMASDLTLLDASIHPKLYNYSISFSSRNQASVTASLGASSPNELRNYSGSVILVPATGTQPEFYGSIICGTLASNVIPIAGLPPDAPLSSGTCPVNMRLVE